MPNAPSDAGQILKRISRTQQATDELAAMLIQILEALDACEFVLGAGFPDPRNPINYVIPYSRHDRDVSTVVEDARKALKLAGRR